MTRPAVVATVAAGGALGAVARFALTAWLEPATGFPWATFGINVAGSFLLGLLPALPAVRRSPRAYALLGPGLLGGFTTLSAYSEQTRALLAAEALGTATAYLAGTLLACLLAVALATRLVALAPSSADEKDG